MRPPTQRELTEPTAAYIYALEIVKGRWEQGEPVIMSESYWSYCYTRNIIKCRWEQAEPIIVTNAYLAYKYAQHIIRGRWIEAEPHIAKNRNASFDYVHDVLKFDPQYVDFYERCFRNNTLNIDDLTQKLRSNDDIQLAYFKAKVLT
jgi:hypothetical protein